MAAVQERAHSAEKSLLENVRFYMDRIKLEHPQWHADLEDIDPFVADRSDVEALLDTAPTDFAKGYITGIMVIRQQVAIVTGREF